MHVQLRLIFYLFRGFEDYLFREISAKGSKGPDGGLFFFAEFGRE